MTAIRHLALGMAISAIAYHLLGPYWWLCFPVIFLSHTVIDAICQFHPPGTVTPWKPAARVEFLLTDQWQYGRNAILKHSGPTEASPYFVTSKWALFLANCIILPVMVVSWCLGWIDWRNVTAGMVQWLAFDIWWVGLLLFPDNRFLVSTNPHRLVTKLRAFLQTPVDWWPYAYIEIMDSIWLFLVALAVRAYSHA